MKIVIVGNGVAGTTCALAARERDSKADITLVGEESDYFFSRTALMYAFLDRLSRRELEPYERGVYSKKRLRLVRDKAVDLDAVKQTLSLNGGEVLAFDRLVLATGSKANFFPWKGLEREMSAATGESHLASGVVHFVGLQDLDVCEALVPSTKRAVVVGGGLIGIELVECLLHHGVKVTFLVREPFFWPVSLCAEEAALVLEEMKRHGVDVRLGDELARVEKGPDGRVSKVETMRGETLFCEMLGLCVGVKPNVAAFQKMSTPPRTRRGFLVSPTLETSLPGVFACGDCAEILSAGPDGAVNFESPGQALNELIWYSAKRQGELVAQNLFGDALVYEPPLFFNSSKFFDMEYTTVGDVVAASRTNPSWFAVAPNGRASLRVVHAQNKVVGFNVLGARVDHGILAKWISEKRSVDECMERFKEAQYDVEFGRVPVESFARRELPPTEVKP
ncbi:MAG: FAD-dependent oxidoreductase [Silvanigrellales bacterium]|nr:FAD-dependent oxidoreductase [Silvanigrellales bacterium]